MSERDLLERLREESLQLARRSAELKVQVGAVLTDRLVTLTGLTNFNSLD